MAAFRHVALLNAALLAGASLALAGAAPTSRQVIGVVMTSVPGEALTVNGLGAVGNASLTEGARVEAGSVPAQIRLSNGVRATVEAGSRAQVFANHIVVEQGSATTSAKSYSVQSAAVGAKSASGAGASSTPAPGALKSAAQAGKPGAPNGAVGVKPGSGPPSLPALGSSWFSGDDHQGGFGNHGGSGGGHGGFGDGHDGDHDGGKGNGGDHDGDHGGHDGDHDHDHGGHHHHHCPPPVSRP